MSLAQGHNAVTTVRLGPAAPRSQVKNSTTVPLRSRFRFGEYGKGSLTLAMGKCLWLSVKIKVCQSSLSSP